MAAIKELDIRQEPKDFVTITEELKGMGQLEEAGGASYLSSLVDRVPVTKNIAAYAEIVKQNADKRKTISLARNLADKGFDPTVSAQELLDYLQTEAMSISGSGSQGAPFTETLKGLVEEIEVAYKDKPSLLGISTGFRALDAVMRGLQDSDLIVFAGRPSMGKTALALGMAKSALKEGIRVQIFSLEMSSLQLALRMLASECGISGQKLRLGRFGEGDWPRITRACGRLHKFDIVIDDTPGISELELARRARVVRPGLLIVDYLGLMKSAISTDRSRKDLEVGNITGALKGLAKELSIPVVVLSQLNRKVEDRQEKRPQLSDLRESGAIEQDADLVGFIYRDELYYEDSPDEGIAEINITKHRNGPTGLVRLAFREELASFGDLAQE
jgi:replicative DNA helicase